MLSGAVMKRVIFFLTLVILLSTTLVAADDRLKRGMALYKKHRYEDALKVLPTDESAAKMNRQPKIYLSLGMICLENAKLYRELYQVSLSVNLDYLTRLITEKNQFESHLAKLYLGKTLLKSGELSESAAFFDKFLTENNANPKDKQIAQIGLGNVYYLKGKRDRARRYWSKLNTNDPETMSALASAYSSAGVSGKEPLAMSKNALDLLRAAGKKPPIQVINNAVDVYTREGRVDESFQLLKHADLRACFHEETLVKNKVIRFYDPALLMNLSRHYAKAGIEFLQKARATTDKKVQMLSGHYLSEGYELFGPPEQAGQVVEEMMSSGRLPPRLDNRARIRQAIVLYLRGDRHGAEKQLSILLKSKSDPDLTAELLLACANHKIDYSQALVAASILAKRGEGKQFAKLNFAIGKYYLWKKDYMKAVTYMEAARDKSNKNRIEYNNPLMLTCLADAYYHSRNFSEALEIFFEMSKQYPAVRQIQVAMQGVYSMEQQSAGDAKIF
jgi:tetratricopeptide (TPR) repeat protein